MTRCRCVQSATNGTGLESFNGTPASITLDEHPNARIEFPLGCGAWCGGISAGDRLWSDGS